MKVFQSIKLRQIQAPLTCVIVESVKIKNCIKILLWLGLSKFASVYLSRTRLCCHLLLFTAGLKSSEFFH
jgi:hypothetical protein